MPAPYDAIRELIDTVDAERTPSDRDLAVLRAALASLRAHDQPPADYWLGRIIYAYHERLGIPDTSERAFQRALDHDPTHIDARYMLVCASFDRGAWPTVLDQVEIVLADPRLQVPLQAWRRLKALELRAVALAETGRLDASTALAEWYAAYEAADEMDRAAPIEAAALARRAGLDPTRFPLLEGW